MHKRGREKLLADQLWAKKNDRHGKFTWLSLSQHLEDTRLVAGMLWEHWLSRGQKKLILDGIGMPGVDEAGKMLCQFLGSIHDLGKSTPAFQLSPSFISSPDLDSILFEKIESIGFENVRNLKIPHANKTKHALASQWLLEQNNVNEDISSIIGSHHGKPIDDENYKQNQYAFISNYYQVENESDMTHQLWKKTQDEILTWSLKVNGYKSVEELPIVSQPAQVILSGLVIMADWISSNENYFPLWDIEHNEVESEYRLYHGWEKWQSSEAMEFQSYWDVRSHYLKRFSFEPRDIQLKFSEIINQIEDPGILILEAPMGIGKTEAALIGAEQLAQKTGRSGLFFGLPTQATSNGIFPRIQDWLSNLAEDYDERVSIQLVHGKAALNEEFTSLSSNINIDDSQESTVITNQWFSGRKTSSLDDFVVGTVDQLLLLALKQKHLALRHLGMSKKVVIVDEIHAYDAYMCQYLNMALTWLAAYGVPVILLSATLPVETRKDFIFAYQIGRGYKRRELVYSDESLKSAMYPLITYTDGKLVKQELEFQTSLEKEVIIIKLEEEILLDKVQDLITEGGVVGVIVNTVSRAQNIAWELSDRLGDDTVELLHSHFIATDRYLKELNLLRDIGKSSKRPLRKVIVGTQVIEQSLDIDFDVLISDLAPMDLLIQRIGRLHRHTNKRPKQHQKPVTYVLGTDDNLEFSSGAEYIYGGYLLARTQYFLPTSISIPSSISTLVQKVYGTDEVIFGDGRDLKYEQMKDESNLKIQRKRDRAKSFRIEKPIRELRFRKRPSLIGWLKNINPNETEEYGYAQVRDTNETIEVIALKQIGCGYGLFDSSIDISGEIGNDKVAKEIAKHSIRLPFVLTAPYQIHNTIEELEKYNIINLRNWQKTSWLKGSLGIIFSPENKFKIGGWTLHYDTQNGLTYERSNDE